MPELPEVETIRRGLEPYVVGRRVVGATVREARLRWPVPPDLSQRLTGRRISGLTRRSKYLLFDLGPERLLVHLGMSGRLLLVRPDTPPRKHDHLDLHLSGDLSLRFHDPRRFGTVLPWPGDAPPHTLLAGLGPEPLDAVFDGAYLHACTRGRRAPIKTLLMDAGFVVGVGNIYASEALFAAGIRPGRAAGRLTRADTARLARAVKDTLERAITLGGTTLRDFADAHGAAGYFQQELMVYGRAGEPCRVCSTTIRGLRLGQRSAFYCPVCQR